jgi:hypothetical protein
MERTLMTVQARLANVEHRLTELDKRIGGSGDHFRFGIPTTPSADGPAAKPSHAEAKK